MPTDGFRYPTWQIGDPRPMAQGRPPIEQTIEAILFIERHRDKHFKNLTDVGLWFLKRTLDSLGKVLGASIDPPPPRIAPCSRCDTKETT